MTRKGTKDRIDLMVVTLQTDDGQIRVEITGRLDEAATITDIQHALVKMEAVALSYVSTQGRTRYVEAPAGKKPAAP